MTGYCSDCGNTMCICDEMVEIDQHPAIDNQGINDMNLTDTTEQPDTPAPKLSQQDNPANSLIDTPALIAELWELSDGGKAEWWAGEIVIEKGNTTNAIFRTGAGSIGMGFDHALDIIVRHAERWLRQLYIDRGWFKDPSMFGVQKFIHEQYISLADALVAEMGRGG